jgi:hypothetical protein
MIKLLSRITEKRERDRKRKRLFISFGRKRFHITRKEAGLLLLKLEQVLISVKQG